MVFDTHLYMTLYPNNALVASQLNSELFARHYTTGSSRHYRGKVIFAEIDIEFRDPYFRIEDILKSVHPHEDGRPKATKFICSYRVLEHIDFSAIKRLYLTSQEGYCLGLDSGPYTEDSDSKKIRLFTEITPLRMLVLSQNDSETFGKYITDPKNPKSAPKQFYTQLHIDLEDFLEDFETNPLHPSPIENVHPSIIRDGYEELRTYPEKHYKGIALDSSMDQISFKIVHNGFMFSCQESHVFFPMPDHRLIEEEHYKFWRTM